jgi:hypothetical protein
MYAYYVIAFFFGLILSLVAHPLMAQGCDVVQLFHKEVDCFLASEGPPFTMPGNGSDLQRYDRPLEEGWFHPPYSYAVAP